MQRFPRVRLVGQAAQQVRRLVGDDHLMGIYLWGDYNLERKESRGMFVACGHGCRNVQDPPIILMSYPVSCRKIPARGQMKRA